MSKNQCIKLFSMLARSQGFYGRLLRDINDGYITDEWFEQFKDCKDDIDVILMIES